MEECIKFIMLRREARHNNTLERQTAKYNWLCHKNTGGHSNIQDGNHGKQGRFGSQKQQDDSINTRDHVQRTKTRMINISCKPLTAVEESLLAHGPNYAIVLRGPT